jgi:septum formation protein
MAMIELPHLILASGSPRRAEILTAVGWEFTKDVPTIDEAEIDGESPDRYVLRLAEEKAMAVAAIHPGRLVLGADTTVVLGGGILGKPQDMNDAKCMLSMLSGKKHDVLTGIALVRDSDVTSGLERTTVRFAAMTEAEIEFLAEMGDPLDKAGAYAVQAQAALFIEGIEGDYWNVVGLPVRLAYRLAAEMNGQK